MILFVHTKQRDDDQRFERFLAERSDVSREAPEIDLQQLLQETISEVRRDESQRPGRDYPQHSL